MPLPIKPPALKPGATVRIVAPASPVEEARLDEGITELERLGYAVRCDRASVLARDGYFAGGTKTRGAALIEALKETQSDAVFCARGGYGSDYLLADIKGLRRATPKILLGYSDVTTLQTFLWQKFGWVTFYGPMIAAGLHAGAAAPGGYDADSLAKALGGASQGWAVALAGECLSRGEGKGRLLGGCLSMLQATLGTPWELDTAGAILLLEDRAMKPFQVERALMHLKHAGKLERVRGVILGEFPECEPPVPSAITVRDVCRRVIGDRIPVVWGAPFGHTPRPMLTLPLGVRARLVAKEQGRLEILEAACTAGRKKV
jgi:muramoyltetrapeptide carboxypeptidase